MKLYKAEKLTGSSCRKAEMTKNDLPATVCQRDCLFNPRERC
jgi:hypothetical protein